mmetsp:Transcript_12522/g.27770  ORF Transcript_12522/g.27770 Transcript_12522/m.27770 type:complete len:272 (-) Transcript_12522:678-1493(-)
MRVFVASSSSTTPFDRKRIPDAALRALAKRTGRMGVLSPFALIVVSSSTASSSPEAASEACATASSYAFCSIRNLALGSTTSPRISMIGGGDSIPSGSATLKSDGIVPPCADPDSFDESNGTTPSVTSSPLVPSPLVAPHLNLYRHLSAAVLPPGIILKCSYLSERDRPSILGSANIFNDIVLASASSFSSSSCESPTSSTSAGCFENISLRTLFTHLTTSLLLMALSRLIMGADGRCVNLPLVLPAGNTFVFLPLTSTLLLLSLYPSPDC